MSFKLWVAFGETAADYVGEYGWTSARRSKDEEVHDNVHIKTFKTIEERNAYAQGVSDQAGWMNDACFQSITPKPKKEKNAHVSN